MDRPAKSCHSAILNGGDASANGAMSQRISRKGLARGKSMSPGYPAIRNRIQGFTKGAPHEPELDPPFEIVEPDYITTPLVFSSPHSGSVYPARFLASAKLDAMTLRRSEDAFVDSLFAGATAIGAPLVRARFPRAYLDVNREPYELDPRMFEGRLPAYANTRSVRVAGGLGTVARVVGEAQEIYHSRLKVEEALGRVEKLYKPYHLCLRDLIERAHQTFGCALLVDCHSMPSISTQPLAGNDPADMRVRADFVLGDRYGMSCEPTIIDAVDHELRRQGYVVMRNKPYAGGFITEHYGYPAGGFHAMQIEVNRAIYMDERNLKPTERFDQVAADLKKVMKVLVALLAQWCGPERAAAE
jgi:N-formylglutamate amidohydrolase